jgi:hypothetical protein
MRAGARLGPRLALRIVPLFVLGVLVLAGVASLFLSVLCLVLSLTAF